MCSVRVLHGRGVPLTLAKGDWIIWSEGSNQYVCESAPWVKRSAGISHANAELICRAVNHHEELLQALKALLDSGDDLAIRLLKENSIFVTESYAVATENGYAAVANVEKGNAHERRAS